MEIFILLPFIFNMRIGSRARNQAGIYFDFIIVLLHRFNLALRCENSYRN